MKIRNREPRKFDTFTQEEHDALGKVRKMLVSAPVLALPSSKSHLALDTDAREKKIRCVLMQEQPDRTKKPLTYQSRELSATEQNYNITHREFLVGCSVMISIFGSTQVHHSYESRCIQMEL